jgi:integrase
MLVSRLGVSIEVARMELRDVDWRSGELLIRGKARREDRLPLPSEVGEALVTYLSSGRGIQPMPCTCSSHAGRPVGRYVLISLVMWSSGPANALDCPTSDRTG